MSALVTLVLLVSVFINGVSTKSPVTSSDNDTVVDVSSVQENKTSNDLHIEEPIREQHRENSSVNIENSSILNVLNSFIVNESRDQLDIEDLNDKELLVGKIKKSKDDIKKRTLRLKQIRKILKHISKSTNFLQKNSTNEHGNMTTKENIMDVSKAILRNILTKYVQYKELENNATETNNETLKIETYNDNSTFRTEGKNTSNVLVNFIRLFESESPVVRKRISNYDDDTDDDHDDNTDDDGDDDDKDDIIELVEKIETAEKMEDSDYDISDFIINLLGGAHNNDLNLNPDNDLESRIDYPLDGITNFNNEKQALTTDVVQDHIHSPNYAPHVEHPITDASAGNLGNGKMENLLWKDFFSFEIPDKVTKKPNNVPEGNDPKMIANTHVHKKSAIDGKYDYEEDDDSWESYENYHYPEETYTDYIDEYDVQAPKIGKSKTVVPQVIETNKLYPADSSLSANLFDQNINQRNFKRQQVHDYVDESRETPLSRVWSNNYIDLGNGKQKTHINSHKKTFHSSHSGIDEDSSEEYEDNMIVNAMLPHLQTGKPLNKKTTPFVDSLFNRNKKYMYSSGQDDDSTSHDIEREETDKVSVGIKSLFHNKKLKVHSSSHSSDSSSYSSEKVSSSSEEVDSISSEEQLHFKSRTRKGSDSRLHSNSKEDHSYSSESSLPDRITRLFHNKKSRVHSGSHSSDSSSYSSEKLSSSSEDIDSISSSEEQSHFLRRARKGSSSHSSSEESQSHSSESSLSLSDENSSSYEDYSTENAKKYSDEILFRRHQMNRGGSSGTSESVSDKYSSESFSNENFSSSDEDSLSSSSEENFPVVKEESRFVHIHKPKNHAKPFNHYYTFFKTRDWKRLDENKYVEESRAYHRKHFDDDGTINEVTTPLPKVNVEQLYVSKVKQDVPKRPPQPFVLLQRTAIVRTTPPPPPTPYIPVQTTTVIPPTQPPTPFIPIQTYPPPQPPTPFIPIQTFPPPQPPTPYIPVQTTRPTPPPPSPTPYIPIQVTRVTHPPPPPAPPVVNRIKILKTISPRYQPPPPPPPRPLPKIHIVRTRYTTPRPTTTPPPPPPPPQFRPIPRLQLIRIPVYPTPAPRPIPNTPIPTPKPTPKPNYLQWLPIIYNKIMNFRKVNTPIHKPVQPKKPTSYDVLENEIMQIDVQKAWTNSYQNNVKKGSYAKSSYKKPNTYSGGYQNLSYMKPTYGSYSNAYSKSQPQGSHGKYGRAYSRNPFQKTKTGYGYNNNENNGYFNRSYRNKYSPKLSRFNVPYHISDSNRHYQSNVYGQLHKHFGHSAKEDCDTNSVHGNVHFAANKNVNPHSGLSMNGFHPIFNKWKY